LRDMKHLEATTTTSSKDMLKHISGCTFCFEIREDIEIMS